MNKKLMCWLAAILLFAGCRANPNVFDPFTPYQTQCIPPPPTGSIGAGSGYYNGPSAAPAAMQPVPSLSNQAPPEPRTSSLPPGASNENWESAERPGLDFGAQSAPAASEPPFAPQRPLPANLRPSKTLAWAPPFQGSNRPPASYDSSLAQANALEFVSPGNSQPYAVIPAAGTFVANGPAYRINPVRPAVARSATCNCFPEMEAEGNLQPQAASYEPSLEANRTPPIPGNQLQWH